MCWTHLIGKGRKDILRYIMKEREKTVRSNVTAVVFGETFEETFEMP